MRGNGSVANHMYDVANCHPKFMSFCKQAAQQAKEVCAHIHSCARLQSRFEDVHVGHALVSVVSVLASMKHDGEFSIEGCVMTSWML